MEIIPSEIAEHNAFIDWVRLQPKIRNLLIHVPNEYAHGVIGGAIRKRLGVRKGVSDFFIPLPVKSYHGLWIELKRISGSKVSKEQKDWLELMQSLDYKAEIAYGAGHAIDIVKRYMDSQKGIL